MDIEKLAVSKLDDIFSKTDLLQSNISKNDKDPSWDGFIEVYKKRGNVHSKKDLIKRVPIQVKGHMTDTKGQKFIKYPIDTSDLRNYLCEGGTVFIVVYLDKQGECTGIYYVSLLPYDIKQQRKKLDKQETISFRLDPLPQGKKELSNLFLNIAKDIIKQKSYIDMSDDAIEKLKEKGKTSKVSVTFSSICANDERPFESLLGKSAYFYADVVDGIKIPIGRVQRIDSIRTEHICSVLVGDKQYYSSIGIEFRNDDDTLITLGKRIFLSFDNANGILKRIDIKDTDIFDDYYRDEEFLVKAFAIGRISIDGKEISLEELFSEHIDEIRETFNGEKLKELTIVKKLLELLDVSQPMNCKMLNQQALKNITMLKKAIVDKEKVNIDINCNGINKVSIGNLYVLVVAIREVASKMVTVLNFNDADIKMEAEEHELLSKYMLLNEEDFLKVSNINYSKLYTDVTSYLPTTAYCAAVIDLILNLLNAYDDSQDARKDILQSAKALAKWIYDVGDDTNKVIAKLNYLQAVKRERELNVEETAELLEIIENSHNDEEIYFGAYLLRNDLQAAKYHFNKMSKESQNKYRLMPIFRFWEKVNNLED
ncbi:DUF4365 domain-containing protein [Phascolarctobacterium sp.]|uniref:DUF4365 domain-containing protein n=1 Tax=Phascolarctobacterium sp. TaxID=2049039 RepID=UPI00386EF085